MVELRNRAASVRAALDASMPRPPVVSCALEGRELALAEEAALAYEPTGRDIMKVLGNIANNMVVKDDLRVEITEALHPVHAHMESINAKSERALDETRVLNERLALIERDKLSEGDRVANLEAEIRSLKAQLAGGSNSNSSSAKAFPLNDPAFKQISFLGFPKGSSRQDMISEMERVSREKFADCKPSVTEIRYKGPYGKREATLNGYIEFSYPDVREAALKAFGKDASITVKGTKVSIKPAKTRIDAHRDAMLNMAADRIKAHAGAIGKTVEIKKGSDRCVKVDGNVAFQQAARKSNECGKFAAPFADISLPE